MVDEPGARDTMVDVPEAEFVSWETNVCAAMQLAMSDCVQRAIDAKAIVETCRNRGFPLPKKLERAMFDEVSFEDTNDPRHSASGHAKY